MKNLFKICLFIFVFIYFTGCINNKHIPYVNEQYTDFKSAIDSLVVDMYDDMMYVIPKSKNLIYVSDFVNIKNLHVTSQLGLFLASEVKSNVTKHFNVKIKEITYSKYIKLNDSGSRILSRDTADILDLEENKTHILVGTYALTSKQLMLYLKLIDMKNGEIIKSTSTTIQINDEIKELEKSDQNTIVLRPHVVL